MRGIIAEEFERQTPLEGYGTFPFYHCNAGHIGREECFVVREKWHNDTDFREEAERKLESGLPRCEEELPEAMEENVRRLMRTGAITCVASDSIREVAQILAVDSSHYGVATNQNHEVPGVISARSILRPLTETSTRPRHKISFFHIPLQSLPILPLRKLFA